MEKNAVYHLAQSLQNTEDLQEAFSHLQHTLYDIIEKNYLHKIQSAVRLERDMSIEHPAKEITLLRAFAPFTDEKGQERIQQICSNLLFLQTLGHIQENVKSLSMQEEPITARNAGGKENLPISASANFAGLLMIWSLLSDFYSS